MEAILTINKACKKPDVIYTHYSFYTREYHESIGLVFT